MDENINYNIYVDIDSIFDTRMPMYASINHDIFINSIKENKYHTRMKESIGLITPDIIKSIYRNRNRETFRVALPTEMLEFLKELVIESNHKRKLMNELEPIKIYLNIYPYELLEEEKETIRTLLYGLYKGIAEVEIINKSNEELEPIWILDNVASVIKYDALDWVELNVNNNKLISTPLFSVHFFTPKMITGNVADNEITNELFENIMFTMSTLITLVFLNTELFCFKK